MIFFFWSFVLTIEIFSFSLSFFFQNVHDFGCVVGYNILDVWLGYNILFLQKTKEIIIQYYNVPHSEGFYSQGHGNTAQDKRHSSRGKQNWSKRFWLNIFSSLLSYIPPWMAVRFVHHSPCIEHFIVYHLHACMQLQNKSCKMKTQRFVKNQKGVIVASVAKTATRTPLEMCRVLLQEVRNNGGVREGEALTSVAPPTGDLARASLGAQICRKNTKMDWWRQWGREKRATQRRLSTCWDVGSDVTPGYVVGSS